MANISKTPLKIEIVRIANGSMAEQLSKVQAVQEGDATMLIVAMKPGPK